MQLTIDTENKTLIHRTAAGTETLPLYTREAFELISDMWVKLGWSMRHSYTFTWMGRPFIQLPEDALRIQEVIYTVKPDFIVETGVAHGGSLIFYASLFEAMGHGKVIGVDIEIRPQNRQAIEAHALFKRIQLVEGSSTAPEVVAEVKRRIPAGAKVLVILDSNHTKAHVAAELECYHELVAVGSYIVATDGIMSEMHDVPRGNKEWIHDNPTEAALEFAARHADFLLEQPPWLFNEGVLQKNITHWPGAWLKRVEVSASSRL